jgi:hypothetical protein
MISTALGQRREGGATDAKSWMEFFKGRIIALNI